MQKKLFEGYKVGSNGIEVSYLQYADDTLFIGGLRLENILTIKVVLRCFELASRLKINFSKSQSGAISVSEEVANNYANFLYCKRM